MGLVGAGYVEPCTAAAGAGGASLAKTRREHRMTAYSHQAVGDQMALIMDNVIRRFMSESQWFGTWDDGFYGNGWDERLPGKFGSNGTVQLRLNALAQTATSPPPPGARYLRSESQGQMYHHVYEVDPDAIYLPFVERVNDAFRGWRSLPDPADFEGPITALEQAVDELTPEAQSSGGYTFVNVEVSNAMDLVRTWVSPQGNGSSDLLYAFDSAYGPGRMAGVMTNQAQVAAGLGFTVAGEKQLWTKARADIMAIAREAASALDVGGGGGGSIDLGVVKAFLDLAAVFVPKTWGVLVEAASAGVGFLDEITPEPTTSAREVRITGDTAEAMLSSMEQAIRDLETSIFDEEAELIDRLQVLQDALATRASTDFHIHPEAGIDGVFSQVAEMRFNSAAVQGVGRNDVPTIAGAFLRAADHASSDTGAGIWTRDNMIGYGTTGPHGTWTSVIDQFDQVSTGTARELVEAGKLLAVAAGWIEDADVEAGISAQGLGDELERGETGWSYPTSPTAGP